MNVAELLLYQEMEMGALVCYNMATADHTQGCAAKHVPNKSVSMNPIVFSMKPIVLKAFLD